MNIRGLGAIVASLLAVTAAGSAAADSSSERDAAGTAGLLIQKELPAQLDLNTAGSSIGGQKATMGHVSHWSHRSHASHASHRSHWSHFSASLGVR